MRKWTIRLTAAAEMDFEEIVQWTIEKFGQAQALVYAETISMAIEALSEGPTTPGVKPRDEILKGLFSLHVARERRKGSHFIMFQIVPDGEGDMIEVLRLLHDSMDLPRHFSSED